jgi:adenylosuccinate synthase
MLKRLEKMPELVQVDFAKMSEKDLEFRVISEFTPSFSRSAPRRRFVVISPEEARARYFPEQHGKTNVYVVIGGQKGDEQKAMALEIISRCHKIGWGYATNSLDNAGKGVHTKDESGRDVRVSLHVCPETVVNPEMRSYIGSEVRVNLFNLEEEITEMKNKTGRTLLGERYHLMVDSYANLITPTERADDVVGKRNAMGSTVKGATAVARDSGGKMAPMIEDVLYDNEQFLRHVRAQIVEFEDRLKHDKEFVALGIDSMYKLGCALQLKTAYEKNPRLEALAKKLSEHEKRFLTESKPAEYLLEQFKAILQKNLFFIGDTKTEINELVSRGISGSVECVQSCLLSGVIRYSKNRTAAGTNSASTIGDGGLIPEPINYVRILVFKFGNTSVGGNDLTMSGFIPQDGLAELIATTSNGAKVCFEKPEALREFLTHEQIYQAFNEVTAAFFEAVHKRYSVKNSKVRIKGIDTEMSLAEARALFTSYKWNEKGETSGRARICRFDDMVETGVVYRAEGHPLQIRNAIDRALDLPEFGIITAYEVVRDYGGYKVGDIIRPGMQLRQEHLTVRSCIPIIDFLPRMETLAADGTNNLPVGAELHPDLCNYLAITSDSSDILAIGNGPKIEHKVYVGDF